MNYNVIGIDPSLISTGLVVNGKLFNYCRESDATNKSGLSKWFKYAQQCVSLGYINYREYSNYSEGELIKLKDYDLITSGIIGDIKSCIDNRLPTKIGIEGYSYASSAGAIIDLVTFSTLLRKKLFDYISEDITVYSPSTLKLEACKLTYPPVNGGKKREKWVYKNNRGVSGGSFSKHDMFLSIIENSNINDDWSNLCRSLSVDIMESKKVPKPFEDINDAWLIYQIIKNKDNFL